MKLTKRDWNKLKAKNAQLGEHKAVRMSRLPKKAAKPGSAVAVPLVTILREHVNPDFVKK